MQWGQGFEHAGQNVIFQVIIYSEDKDELWVMNATAEANKILPPAKCPDLIDLTHNLGVQGFCGHPSFHEP